ncbi:MAG: GntR family transcriptional regulator [Caldilinea sp.]|nr:GntR family transcriptional regulator [Caldilineaceae bacterium]MCB9118372.1 GntR family transcriptional regulator [Caldilineaceae bacterium]MCB9124926.1 GntR family transcriptional regulator [Caldilineaceae bacterium]MCO5213071.1 GntR family transcriptional regulator [Caldilinea sp.]
MNTKHSRLVDEVVRTLSGAILSGELRPGDRLTVLPIAQEFGISQSTTREALLMLEQRGLVKTNPRRGTFVTRLSEVEAIELCRMRALVEAYTITVGGALIASDTLDALRQQVEAMGKCVLPKDMPQLIQHDLIFHQMIAELGGSELLLELWSSLSGRIGALILRSLEDKKLNVADVVRYHAEVIDALESREPEIGRRAIIQHYIRGQLNEQAQTDALSAVAQTTFALSAADAD